MLQVLDEGERDTRYRGRPQRGRQRPTRQVQLGQGVRRSQQRAAARTGNYNNNILTTRLYPQQQ